MTSKGVNFLESWIDITPATTGSWTDVNVSSYVEINATGVMLRITNTDSGLSYKVTVRKKGSTDSDENSSYIAPKSAQNPTIGLDTNKIFQAYIENAAVKIYLLGWTGSSAYFFDNMVDTGNAGCIEYGTAVNISSVVPSNTEFLFIKVVNQTASTHFTAYVASTNSTPCNTGYVQPYHSEWGYIGALGTPKTINNCRDSNDIKIYIIGYGVAPFKLGASDHYLYDPASDNIWTDVTITDVPTTAKAVFMKLHNYDGAISRTMDCRKNDNTNSDVANSIMAPLTHRGLIIGIDDNRIMENYTDGAGLTDHYVMGYVEYEEELITRSYNYKTIVLS